MELHDGDGYRLCATVIYYAFRHRMTAGLTIGGVKG
jgi:hypothetical protein